MEGYEKFKSKIFKLTGLDLSLYKEKQMKRRLESRIRRYNKSSYEAYYDLIVNDREAFDGFMNYLTINVSEFYRNPEQWKKLDEIFIPEMLKRTSNLRVWSAACSTGEEPYSLVMLLSNHLPLSKIKILAMDLDEEAIRKAKVGLYSEKSLENLPISFKQRYFSKVGSSFKISEDIKKCVEFKKINLLADKYPEGFDLISCRNVMIYFTDKAKDIMYQKFSEALKPDGLLFVGSTEQIMSPKDYKFRSDHTFFYKKVL